MEGEVAVFTTSMIDLYGPPDYFGYDKFIVVSDNESPFVLDYEMQHGNNGREKLRPIHRYNRVERFTKILGQLLGVKGVIPTTVFALVKDCTSWDDIRSVLKRNGNKQYYNLIPTIMKKLGLQPPIMIELDNTLFLKMVNDFMIFQDRYIQMETTQKYFPSLRYIAFKILQDNYADFDSVLFIRTPRVEKKLEAIWDSIMYV